MISDLNGSLGSRQFLNVANERTCFASCASTFKHVKSTGLFVIFQKRVRVFHRRFKHEKTDEGTRPQAECFYCFRVFETPMKHEARVFEITSLTKEN